MKDNSHILRYIQSQQKVALSDLAKKYSLSAPTIRRYIAQWETEALVTRFHGHVCTADSSFLPLKLRMLSNVEQKKAIARKAAELVSEGDTIFLGGGATIAHMCEYLTHFQKITIITNSLYIINYFANYKNISIVSIGGILLFEDNVFTGNFTQMLYEKLFADKVFLGAEAVHFRAGISKALRLKELNEHFMLQRGKLKIILVGSEKINQVFPLIITPISDINVIVTDPYINSGDKSLFIQQNIQVYSSDFYSVDTQR